MAGAVVVISSHVARGSVGNRAMTFALERLGFEVWAVPTILLSHHPGHGPSTRIVPDDDEFATLLRGVLQRDGASRVVAVVSGYLGSPRQAGAVATLVRAVKMARPDALYLCDPVIGDGNRLYVAKEIAAALRQELLPVAGAITPNAFECAWLARKSAESAEGLAEVARTLAPVVLVTSAPAMMAGQTANLLVTERETMLFEHPLIATPVKGTGDLLAALFLARRLEGNDWSQAAERALASVFEILSATAKAGADELMLPRLQGAIAAPQASVSRRRIGPALRG